MKIVNGTVMGLALEKALTGIQDAQLLIGNSVMVAATAQFYHVKKLAEEGNEEAKRQYEKLLPLYKQSIDPSTKGNQFLN